MYKVETTKDKKGNTAWIIRCPDGGIANQYQHPSKQSADRHCEICNVFFGELNENANSNKSGTA